MTAAVHEPPAFALLSGNGDPVITDALALHNHHLEAVATLIDAGDHRSAAERFIETVALGRGAWAHLPATFRAVVEANAATFLDELRDPTASSIDAAALRATAVPVLLSQGTRSPPLFPAVVAELARLVPTAQVHTYTGAGHLPHATHPDDWVTRLVAFHDRTPAGKQPSR